MRIRIVSLVLVCFLTFSLGIFSTCLNVQIQNAKPKVIVRGLVTRTINFKHKALAYLEKLYSPAKDPNDYRNSVASEGGGWFVHFYRNIPTGMSNNTVVDAMPVGIEGVQ